MTKARFFLFSFAQFLHKVQMEAILNDDDEQKLFAPLGQFDTDPMDHTFLLERITCSHQQHRHELVESYKDQREWKNVLKHFDKAKATNKKKLADSKNLPVKLLLVSNQRKVVVNS